MPSRHPSDDVLEEYSLDRLPEVEAAVLEEHLLICEQCQDRLAETDAYVRTLRRELRAEPPHSWSRFVRGCRFWLLGPAPAAAVVVLAVTLVFWFVPQVSRPVPEPPLELSLVALRGAATLPRAPTGRALALRLDTAGLPPLAAYRLQVVDAAGRRVVDQKVRLAGGLIVLPGSLAPGRYWVRLHETGYAAALLREFGLQVGGR